MSRVGKKPILIPEGVQVQINGQNATVKGAKGELSRRFSDEVRMVLDGGKVAFICEASTKQARSLWGTSRAILANMIKGVKEGFEKKLKIEGLGYKAVLTGNVLELNVGFTHPIKIEAPEGVKFTVEKDIITVSGADLEKVSLLAAQIKKAKKPEPYKGAGIRYLGEQIRRKEGKKAVATTK